MALKVNRNLSLSGITEQKHLLICKRVDLEHRKRAALAGKTKCVEMLKIFDDPRSTVEAKKRIELEVRKQTVAYQRSEIIKQRNNLRKL